MKKSEIVPREVLADAMVLIMSSGQNVGGFVVHHIDSRLTIQMQPTRDGARPKHLTITRHRDFKHAVVLSAVWPDGDGDDNEPMIVSYVGGPWREIIARAVRFMPVSVIPT